MSDANLLLEKNAAVATITFNNPKALNALTEETFTGMEALLDELRVLADDMLEEELQYLDENLDGILAMVADGAILGIELPATVSLEITETAPAMKAASSAARTKPATLSTGLVVQVPEYLTPGEFIKVNTASGEYVSRA